MPPHSGEAPRPPPPRVADRKFKRPFCILEDSLRPILAGQIPECAFRRIQGTEERPTAQRCVRAGKQDRSATMRLHSIDRFAPEQEPVETAYTPTVLEILGPPCCCRRCRWRDPAKRRTERNPWTRLGRGRDISNNKPVGEALARAAAANRIEGGTHGNHPRTNDACGETGRRAV